jgi:hypothetical protein
MKNSLLLFGFIALMFAFACKKDGESDPFKAGYTKETVEESKSNVEQNAVDLVDQLDAMTSAKAIKVLMNLNDLQNGTEEKSALKNPVLEPLSLMSTMSDKSKAGKAFDRMKRISQRFESDPVSFSALFDSIAGKYTYNFGTGSFDKTELADQVVFEFPGLKTDQTNTAVITVNNFSVADISDPFDGWPSGLAAELPASIKADLKYNGNSIAGFTLSASYKSDGMPTKVNLEMFVDDFTLTMTAVHSPYTSASNKNTLKFKDAILFETYIAAEGDWSQANIDSSKVETEYGTDLHIDEIIHNANAHVILMNLNVVGTVDVKTLGDSLWALDKKHDLMSEEAVAQAQVNAINASAKLVVIYRDSNTKIAEAEAYVAQEDDGYGGINYYPDMRFVYADGSKVDINTYINNELDSFYTSVNDFIDKLNTEYGLSIDHVNPDAK